MSTFEPMEFKNWQREKGPEPVKYVNIKPGKENQHVKIVRDVLYSMYPHANKQGSYEYDVYMEKAVRKFQDQYGYPVTGTIAEDQLKRLAEISGKFRVV